MIKILGEKYKFCDGVSRRSFLKIGGLTMGGLALPQILQAEENEGAKRPHKAIALLEKTPLPYQKNQNRRQNFTG